LTGSSTPSWNDFRGRAILVTGGTKGIGLGIGLAFGKRGAQVTLTQKWGSADVESIRSVFLANHAPEPQIADADVAHDDDAREVLEKIRKVHSRLDVLVSNVAFAPVVHSIDEYTRRGLASAIEHSTWPIVSYCRLAREVFGSYPPYVIALSSAGAETYHVNYDMVAASKAALEALCRYMNQRLRAHGSRVNVVRTRFTSTDSLRATFGDEFEQFVEARAPGSFTTPAEIGDAIVGLCSGLMDAVGGQVITVDKGASVFENFSRLFSEREVHPLKPRGDAS
jgi:NAD(P)-dependent dehydrogenase (short-subunit alcohol dehydrogenase family)